MRMGRFGRVVAVAATTIVVGIGLIASPAAAAPVSPTNPSCAWQGTLPKQAAYSPFRSFVSQLDGQCHRAYAVIVRRLGYGRIAGWHPHAHVMFHFTWSSENPIAATEMRSGVVTLNIGYFNRHPGDWGAVYHELTHVAQNYPAGQPAFIVEGVADYMRFYLGGNTVRDDPPFESYSRARCPAGQNYTSGYGCAAALLKYANDVYHSDATLAVHELALQGRGSTYSATLQRVTHGRGAVELWRACNHYERYCDNGR
ncbi:MAG TPA: basic secretory protein-like protein [Actinocatenispora sp.]